MDLELSGRRVATISLRSRTREVIRSGWSPKRRGSSMTRITGTPATDYLKSEGRQGPMTRLACSVSWYSFDSTIFPSRTTNRICTFAMSSRPYVPPEDRSRPAIQKVPSGSTRSKASADLPSVRSSVYPSPASLGSSAIESSSISGGTAFPGTLLRWWPRFGARRPYRRSCRRR